MAEEERILEVTPDFDGKRIDQCLAASFSDCSRSFLQKLLKDGKVSINGKTQKASSKVAAGDAVLVLLPEPEELNVEPENIPLDILYEDDDLLVVNKPKGMVVHPAAGHSSGTLVNAVLYHCRGNLSGINGVLRPGIVHRIDMDTTGALVICKSDFAHQSLAEQLSVHSVTIICFHRCSNSRFFVTSSILQNSQKVQNILIKLIQINYILFEISFFLSSFRHFFETAATDWKNIPEAAPQTPYRHRSVDG